MRRWVRWRMSQKASRQTSLIKADGLARPLCSLSTPGDSLIDLLTEPSSQSIDEHANLMLPMPRTGRDRLDVGPRHFPVG